MRLFLTIFVTLISISNAYLFQWIGATGMTGVEVELGCPETAAEALEDYNGQRLSECSEDTLREFYHENGCCYNFIAECNIIERAWWQKTDVLKPQPLCEYKQKIMLLERRRLRRSFLRRIKARNVPILDA